MACEPRRRGDARVPAGLNGVPLGHGRRTTPTGGARLSVAAGGEGRDGPGRRKRKGNGPAMGFWAAGRKKEKEGEGDGLGQLG